jgi:hypothetical protein
MLWRWGTFWNVGQAALASGLVSGDFRQTFSPDGYSSLHVGWHRTPYAAISPGRHTLVTAYDGRQISLILDGEVVDIAPAVINIHPPDGYFWVARNGEAAYPSYFDGTVHSLVVCKGGDYSYSRTPARSGCMSVVKNTAFGVGQAKSYPIGGPLVPALPSSVDIDVNLSRVDGPPQMLWQYGQESVIGQASVENGVLYADYRQTAVPDYPWRPGVMNRPGNRRLSAPIAPGRHRIRLSYDGSRAELRLDGTVVDSATGAVDITQWQGMFWVGRFGGGTSGGTPLYWLEGTVNDLNVCNGPLDATPPVVTPVLSSQPNLAGWHRQDVTLTWEVSDPESGIATKSGCDPATVSADTPGASFTCNATNGAGLAASATAVVRLDKTAPVLVCSVTPAVIWPPNNKLVPVTVTVDIQDALSGQQGFTLAAASSTPAAAPGDIAGFVPGTSSVSGQLKADKGKTYVLAYQGQDRAGNTGSCTVRVSVPHDQGK